MINYTINEETRKITTDWEELTLGEYVRLLSCSISEAVCLLSGLTMEEFSLADEFIQAPFVELAQTLLQTEPKGFRPEWLGVNLGADTIGKMELCRKFLREQEEHPEQAFPFIYAVYRFHGRYDEVLAMAGAGFPAFLIKEASEVALPEALGAVHHVISEINRLDERYAPILEKEPTLEQIEAGIERFEKYGFFATLMNYCKGDLTKAKDLLQIPADVFYTALCVDSEKSDYEEKYKEIISKA